MTATIFELTIIDVERDVATHEIERDRVAILHEGDGASGSRLRCTVDADGPMRHAGHPGIRHKRDLAVELGNGECCGCHEDLWHP